MTTETPLSHPRVSARVLWVTGLVAAALGLALALFGLLLDGSAAAFGALVGSGLAVTVLWGGATVVDLVAGVLPSASLLIAVLTYGLQVVLMGLALLVLGRSGLLDSAVDRHWVGGSVIAVTATWLVAQITLTMRRRIPAYDLGTGGR